MNLPGLISTTLAQTAAAGGAAAQGEQPLGVGLFRQGSTFAAKNDPLFWFILWLCVFFFLLLMTLATVFVFKYRRVPGKPQQRSVSHNTPLELTWSVGPLVILFIVFFWGFDRYMNMQVAPQNAEQISVQAQKWNWAWTYDNGAVGGSKETRIVADKQVPVFAIPAGRPVKLTMISKDVMHSSYVPDFRVKMDLFPNRYITMWFEAPRESIGQEHYLFCAEYCGDQHSQMAAVVKVLDENGFQQYKQDNAFDPSTIPPAELGKILRITKGCAACHSVDGSGGTGPTWTNAFGEPVTFTDGSSVVADENYIRESILDPAKHIVKGFSNQMPSFQGQLKEVEINGLIAYIRSLSKHGGEPDPAKAEGGAGEAPAKPESASEPKPK